MALKKTAQNIHLELTGGKDHRVTDGDGLIDDQDMQRPENGSGKNDHIPFGDPVKALPAR